MAKKKSEKKEEKKTDFEKEINEKKKKSSEFSYPDKVILGGVKYIREDKTIEYANSLPEEITERFLVRKAKRKWYNPFSWFERDEEFKPKGNLLFLMDNEGNMRIYDKVQSGYFKVYEGLETQEKKGKGEPKYIILKPNKLRTITFENEKGNEEYWKCWVADVNNVNALPENPMYDCDDVADIVNKAAAGNKEFNKKDNGFSIGKWLPWIFGALVIGYLVYTAITKNLFGLGDAVGYGKHAVATATQTIVQNATSGNVPGGTLK